MTAGAPTVVLLLGSASGGVGVHVLSLAGAVSRAGWPVTVCAPAETHEVFDFAAAGARIAVAPVHATGTALFAVPAVRSATLDADVVHAHGLRAGTVAGLARPVAGRWPLVVTWHNAVLVGGFKGRALELGERFVARSATVTLTASDDLARRVRRLGGRDVRPMLVAPPAPVSSRSVDAVRAELGVGVRPLIVCIARLHQQKAHDVLIDAAARWRDLDPLVVIAGDGPLRAELEGQIRRRGAPVRLLGRRADVADLLSAADLVVSASRWEARPLALQEAMQLGRPVVATDVGGVADLVGDAAVLVAPGDVDGLAAAVRQLLTDDARREALAALAVGRARTWPDDEQAAQSVIEIYRSLTAQPR
jgi:glycosyltransferase involved in cell wall biosynthesis